MKHYALTLTVVASCILTACASKVRLDDLPPVVNRNSVGLGAGTVYSNSTNGGTIVGSNSVGSTVTGSTVLGTSTSGGQSTGNTVFTAGGITNPNSGITTVIDGNSPATATGLGMNNGASNTTVSGVQTTTRSTTQPDVGLLARRSVFFDYDSSVVRDEGRSILDAHAKNLIANRNTKIALEGHTDERGGREYNLALGQKRAEAVLQALRLLGVPAAQMEPVSYGKEKPRALGNNESGFAENRRVDISYR